MPSRISGILAAFSSRSGPNRFSNNIKWLPEDGRERPIFPSGVRKHKIQKPALVVRLLPDEQAMSPLSQFDQANAFVEIRVIGSQMSVDLMGYLILLQLPLFGHLRVI